MNTTQTLPIIFLDTEPLQILPVIFLMLGIVGLLMLLFRTGTLSLRVDPWIGLGAVLAGLGIVSLFIVAPEYAAGLGVLATLALVFAAFRSIKQVERKNDEEKKERIKDEILDWVSRIIDLSGAETMTLEPSITTAEPETQPILIESLYRIRMGNLLTRIDPVMNNRIRVQRLAEKHVSQLKDDIDNIIKVFFEVIHLLEERKAGKPVAEKNKEKSGWVDKFEALINETMLVSEKIVDVNLDDITLG